MMLPMRGDSKQSDSPKEVVGGRKMLTTLLLVPSQVDNGTEPASQEISKGGLVPSQISVKVEGGESSFL